MKPRIFKPNELWTCARVVKTTPFSVTKPKVQYALVSGKIGRGKTPREAYVDWKSQMGWNG